MRARTCIRQEISAACCRTALLNTLCYAIVLPGRRSGFRAGRFLVGGDQNQLSGRPKAGRRGDFDAFPMGILPKSGTETRFHARKHYCVTQGNIGGRSPWDPKLRGRGRLAAWPCGRLAAFSGSIPVLEVISVVIPAADLHVVWAQSGSGNLVSGPDFGRILIGKASISALRPAPYYLQGPTERPRFLKKVPLDLGSFGVVRGRKPKVSNRIWGPGLPSRPGERATAHVAAI